MLGIGSVVVGPRRALSFAVAAGSDYYVFVDGWVSFGVGVDSADVGEYVLDIDLQ